MDDNVVVSLESNEWEELLHGMLNYADYLKREPQNNSDVRAGDVIELIAAKIARQMEEE